MSDWYPSATRRDGPSWKQGYAGVGPVAPKLGEIKHSAVGYMSGLMSILDGPLQRSWHFSIAYDGSVMQHYPTNAVCWHAGSPRWNIDTVGIEHEGGPSGNESEPLTPEQVRATIDLTRWLTRHFGRPVAGRESDPNSWWLLEHRQVAATACPSGRIPWGLIIPALIPKPHEPQEPSELAMLRALISAGEFVRRAWDVRDLLEDDKQALEWIIHRARRQGG